MHGEPKTMGIDKMHVYSLGKKNHHRQSEVQFANEVPLPIAPMAIHIYIFGDKMENI